MGEYEELRQETITELEKIYDNLKDAQWFFVQKKDGTKIVTPRILRQQEKQS